MKNIFLVWTRYQARVENLAEDISNELGEMEILYRDNPAANKFKKILFYLKYFIMDFSKLLNDKPERIFIQTPPSYALIAPIIYKKLINKDAKIICDLHNAMTRDPW